jgi:hypothetical protein
MVDDIHVALATRALAEDLVMCLWRRGIAGVVTEALGSWDVEVVSRPNLSSDELLDEVQAAVGEWAGEQQVPWVVVRRGHELELVPARRAWPSDS